LLHRILLLVLLDRDLALVVVLHLLLRGELALELGFAALHAWHRVLLGRVHLGLEALVGGGVGLGGWHLGVRLHLLVACLGLESLFHLLLNGVSLVLGIWSLRVHLLHLTLFLDELAVVTAKRALHLGLDLILLELLLLRRCLEELILRFHLATILVWLLSLINIASKDTVLDLVLVGPHRLSSLTGQIGHSFNWRPQLGKSRHLSGSLEI
jgi:hypothetical protein